jgi:hypothetical protein
MVCRVSGVEGRTVECGVGSSRVVAYKIRVSGRTSGVGYQGRRCRSYSPSTMSQQQAAHAAPTAHPHTRKNNISAPPEMIGSVRLSSSPPRSGKNVS